MEFAFNKYCPVEFYQPNLPKGKRKLVLLPFYSYKVFAPRPKNSSINLFQKTILGLLKITRLDVNEIAKILDFHKELVKFVISELVNAGFITKDRDVTEKGKEVLREDLENFSINESEFITGHIYQNPLSLELYPRFNARIQTVEILDADKGDYPRIEIGTKGEPKKEFVYWGYIRNNLMHPANPDPIKIIEAVKRHNRAIERNRGNSEEIEVETLASSQEQKRNDLIQKVNIIAEPQKVFLAVFVVYPLEAVSKNSWKVFDPFGLGESPFLKEYIQLLMNDNKKLEEYIDDIWKQTTEKRKDSYKDFEAILELATDYIDSKLDVRIKTTDFYEILLELEIHYQKYDWYKKRLKELQSIPKEAQKILEKIFNKFYDDFNDSYTNGKLLRGISRDRETNKDYLNGIVNKNGYPKDKIHDSYTRVELNKLQSAANYYKTQSLRPKITLTILACENNVNHPFLKMLKFLPDFYEEAHRIMELRNSEEHAEKKDSTFKNNEATLLQVREDIYKIIKVYLDVTV